MAFSVAPTLGMGRQISRPESFFAVQITAPSSPPISAPSVRRADRCRSMGRGPNSHPPGKDRQARLRRAKSGPKNTTEERIRHICSGGIVSRSRLLAFTRTSLPSRLTVHPSPVKISRAADTSDRSGQLWMTHSPGTRSVPARMGSTLFLLPCTRREPKRGRPPSI